MTEDWSQPTFFGGLTLPSGAVNLYGTNLALQNESTYISYIAPDGTIWYLSGPAAPVGSTGVLMNSFMGMMAPWNMLELRGARQDGATWTGAVYDPTDIQMHLELSGNTPFEIRNVIRRWIGSWDPRQTGILSVFTPDMGEWWANVRLAKTPPDMFKQDYTWTGRQQFTWEIKNYDAFWYGVDSTSTFALGYDTVAIDWTTASNSTTLGGSWTQHYSQSGEGTLGIENGAAQWYPTANQAPTLDAIGGGANTNSGSATSYTWSHTVTSSGVSPALLISFVTTGTVSAVTFNTVEATELASVALPGSSGGTAYLYGLTAPATGTHNVVVTLFASAFLDGNSTSYTNVFGFGTAGSSSGNSVVAQLGASLLIDAPGNDLAAATYFSDSGQPFITWDANTRWTVGTPHVQEFTTPGSFTYNVPAGMQSGDFFDIVLIGSGGGGGGGADFYFGGGGNAGSWTAITLQYGVDIPTGTTSFTGVVGGGGLQGSANQAGEAGGASSVTITGYTGSPLTAAAGAGGAAGAANLQYPGQSPGNKVFGPAGPTAATPYTGGSEQLISGGFGAAPGGGGAGGSFLFSGGEGGAGAVWITSYRVPHWSALSGDFPGVLLDDFTAYGTGNVAAVGVDLEAIQFVNNVNVYNTGSATDNQVVTITLANATFANLFDFLSGGYIDVWGRLNSAGTTGVRLRIGEGTYTLSCFNSGIETVWVENLMIIPPIWDETFTLICGTPTSPYQYLILRDGNQIWSYTDSANTSQVGSSFRDWGFGTGLGINWVTNQESMPCPLSSWAANDNSTVTETGFCPLTNLGDQPGWPRFLLYGPGTFSIANGPGGSPITFGPLYDGQIALVTTEPRLPTVVDLTPNQQAQQLTANQQLLEQIISYATNNNVPPLLQQYESQFGILPPQGNFYSLLSGRFTNPVPGTTPGQAPKTKNIAVGITNGGPTSKIIAAITPQRRWPL